MGRLLFFITMILGCMLLASVTHAHAMVTIAQIVNQLASVR